ncbi:helix-turn-helix transcriptional regulator [Burkholderia pyrrocinia]|uniref:helix-turn-helix transcriptional regulator n=1 Tax=Burkholderia pyrrocinia TaxID=60550 RepID=UPI00104A335D|nr:helix-turn-helix domain-containing protein [Burkholderia pyrrocinia]TDA43635.1 DNA-binding protein [Burkholderia pyrrocinia]
MELQLLTPKALAEILGLAEQTIYNRHSKGGDLPPSIKLGRLLRFPVAGAEAWLARKSSSPGRQPAPAAAPAARRRGRPTKAEQVAARQLR